VLLGLAGGTKDVLLAIWKDGLDGPGETGLEVVLRNVVTKDVVMSDEKLPSSESSGCISPISWHSTSLTSLSSRSILRLRTLFASISMGSPISADAYSGW
jgi:hypothetical protein